MPTIGKTGTYFTLLSHLHILKWTYDKPTRYKTAFNFAFDRNVTTTNEIIGEGKSKGEQTNINKSNKSVMTVDELRNT